MDTECIRQHQKLVIRKCGKMYTQTASKQPRSQSKIASIARTHDNPFLEEVSKWEKATFVPGAEISVAGRTVITVHTTTRKRQKTNLPFSDRLDDPNKKGFHWKPFFS